MKNKQEHTHRTSRRVPELTNGSYFCELVITAHHADLSGERKPL